MDKKKLKRLNDWFYRHGWYRENRGYCQYLYKEQETCFVTNINNKRYKQVNLIDVDVWPSNETISTTIKAVWRSEDGTEIPYDSRSQCFSLTPDEFSKIKELYDLLNEGLQESRKKG
jgi:hypothetical protein